MDTMPPRTHRPVAAASPRVDATTRPVVRKMPAPMTAPTPMASASTRPRDRSRLPKGSPVLQARSGVEHDDLVFHPHEPAGAQQAERRPRSPSFGADVDAAARRQLARPVLH